MYTIYDYTVSRTGNTFSLTVDGMTASAVSALGDTENLCIKTT